MAARAGLGLAGRFLGNAVSESFAFAAGIAIGPVLGPITQATRNAVNSAYPVVPLDPGTLAEGVAQGQIGHDTAVTIASHSGISEANFNHLVDIANVGPGSGYAFDLWRRGVINEAGFRRAVLRLGLEQEWIDDLVKLHDVLLTVSDLANAVVQGHMSQDAAAAEAALQGVSADRFDVLVQNTGLPPGPATLVEWRRRGFIDDAQLDAGIREGHTKTKYIPNFHDALAAQLSTAQIVGLRVKGWISPEESYTLGAGHGFSPAQMDQLWEEAGRPATPHQIHIGYARGAKVEGAANEEDAIRQSVQRSDLQTRYGDVIVAGRYTYPPFLATRTLANAGVLSKAEMLEILLFTGWEPTLAEKVATFYTQPTEASAAANANVTAASTNLRTAIHKAYVKTGVTRAQVEPSLEIIEPDAAARNEMFVRWDAERLVNSEAPPA